MKQFILPFLAMLFTSMAFGQNTFKAIVKDSESKEALIGATAVLEGTTNGSSADENGYIEINNIPNRTQTNTVLIDFQFKQNLPLAILMVDISLF